MKAWQRVLAALALAAALLPAQAGRSCEPHTPDTESLIKAMNLAERTARALDASGADVVVIARSGQDLRKYRLRWSHLGLAYRDADSGAWRIVHKLNECGSDRADLHRQGLAEFFLDDLFQYRAGFAVLKPEVQQRLLPVLRDNRRAAALHTARYNMLAYPWALSYQQSNQWAIETLAAAHLPPPVSRERAQAWLRLAAYEPTVLDIPAFTRLGARMTAANIAFDDHPNEKRYAGRIETVTVDSVFAWLERTGLASALEVLP
ncbi:MAG: DUF2145 domain-containing protein [Rubrivivax sp.]|nr:DUF2145 domain-containing protein [Rubrivivax sp.]